uniref:Glutathione reductase n=1 Tax=Nephromyces sp. MMRI TaxID=2496275 RepID=A0A3Q8UBZ3_9APIC|nr:thioredoxin-disufide reductase [Nephromyces sp. MMRI]AZL94589.1 thioredoxin-disufide reductase [Nephromyces sp. MMRI]AZL94590.1 thioredoxin-disufide reductase [Nephromyces sp. MMRI]AZL94591.1 thioredoxin-disufide reductase [Nephromyces sp. MMRI]AZL94592.1 thioredoxin-disufide reductase [Nephromyces sp. MMRI]
MQHFDLLVIGGGSGGLACARRAASVFEKIGVIEYQRLGGTCVNVGCVPKKVMWNCATVNEIIAHVSPHYGFNFSSPPTFSWEYIKEKRDKFVNRLNGIYANNLKNSNIEYIVGMAKFLDKNKVEVKLSDDKEEKSKVFTADHIVIASGGRPKPLDIPGAQYTINSDGFFELKTLPKRVAIIGSGYIAVELAGVFKGLGVDTNIFVRGESVLRKFDVMLKTKLMGFMQQLGLRVYTYSIPKKIAKDEATGKLTLFLENGTGHEGFDSIIVATGRVPEVEGLGLEAAGVKLTPQGYVCVDKYQNTSTPGVYALGDVCGVVELTPMAIAAARRLADRITGISPNAFVSYDFVPTVIFSHPPIGTVGYTEEEAIKKYGEESLKIYNETSVNLFYGVFDILPENKPKTHIKLICLKPYETIVGLHIIGMGADEMLQGFGVAIKMGATKADFDSCVAIHPTASEEVVTMAPWGAGGVRREMIEKSSL